MKISSTLSLALALALCLAVLAGTLLVVTPPAAAQSSTPGVASLTAGPVSRPQDPVVLPGAELAAFLDQPIAELRLYAYDGLDWAPIPFQVDEVYQGEYVAPGTDGDDGAQGLLDADDELVFMGSDAGVAAGCSASLGLIAANHDRQEIAVADPLNADTGYVYLFHAPSLPASPAAYVAWDGATQTLTGTHPYPYVATFGGTASPPFPGLADLSVNGSGDILDRQKLRIGFSAELALSGMCVPVACTIDEEGDFTGDFACSQLEFLWNSFAPSFDVDLPAIGPVRGVDASGLFALYGSRVDSTAYVPFDQIAAQPVICTGTLQVQLFRISLDLNDSAATGVDTYYNSNGAAVPIDGLPDAVAAAPMIDWQQAAGAPFGGYFAAWHDVRTGTGTAATYYLDDSVAGGTGDGASYGDAGFEIVNSAAASLGSAASIYILPPGTDADAGATYYAYATTPLTATAVAESCALAPVRIYLPLVVR